MSDDLDLGDLSDDQLVALSQAVAMEIGRRSAAVHAAVQQAVLDEAEKLRITNRAAELEAALLRDAERQRVAEKARQKVRAAAPSVDQNGWASRKMLAEMVVETLGAGWSLTVWQSAETAEKRVYLDADKAKVSVYVTGGDAHAPGAIQVTGLGPSAAIRPEIAAIAAAAARPWNRVRFDCDETMQSTVQASPWPEPYKKALAARKAHA